MTDKTPQFTPGPWEAEVHELSEGTSAIVYDARGTCVADHLDEPTAHLIAAAPEMFGALQEACLAMETLARRVFNDNGDHTINTEPLDPDVFSACYYAQRTVCAALAKARGEQ